MEAPLFQLKNLIYYQRLILFKLYLKSIEVLLAN